MRRSKSYVPGCAVACAAAAALVGLATDAGAENRLAVRGTYFREASTRVVQPMLEAHVDLPAGYDVGGHATVDAISSASIAQGVSMDSVFRENRWEGGLSAGKTIDTSRVGAFFRYSNEPDYLSYSGGLTYTQEVWGRTGTIGATLARAHDDIKPVFQDPKQLDVWFLGLSYAQILSPTTLVQGGYELFHLEGFLCNAYIAHGSLGRENCPTKRIRHALAFKVAHFLPEPTLGLQLHYRFYFDQGAFDSLDPWGMNAHTLEGRVYKNLSSDVELRFSYRYHWQSKADFWCNSQPASGGMLDCYGRSPAHHSVDPKFGPLTTHLPELKVTWDLRALLDVPYLQRLARGTLELSYGFYYESTSYGQVFSDKTAPPVIGALIPRDHRGAHIMQTGYSLPF